MGILHTVPQYVENKLLHNVHGINLFETSNDSL